MGRLRPLARGQGVASVRQRKEATIGCMSFLWNVLRSHQPVSGSSSLLLLSPSPNISGLTEHYLYEIYSTVRFRDEIISSEGRKNNETK